MIENVLSIKCFKNVILIRILWPIIKGVVIKDRLLGNGYNILQTCKILHALTLKQLGERGEGQTDQTDPPPPPVFFSKVYLLERGWSPGFF